jgi:hypothetical protein
MKRKITFFALGVKWAALGFKGLISGSESPEAADRPSRSIKCQRAIVPSPPAH